MDGVSIPFNVMRNLPNHITYLDVNKTKRKKYILTDDNITGTIFIKKNDANQIAEVTMYPGQTVDGVKTDGGSWLYVCISAISTILVCIIVKVFKVD